MGKTFRIISPVMLGDRTVGFWAEDDVGDVWYMKAIGNEDDHVSRVLGGPGIEYEIYKDGIRYNAEGIVIPIDRGGVVTYHYASIDVWEKYKIGPMKLNQMYGVQVFLKKKHFTPPWPKKSLDPGQTTL